MAIRYLVPDCSVMLAAYFDERIEYRGRPFDVGRRARPIRRLAREPHVSCFAPDLLQIEFLNVAAQLIHGRTRQPLEPEHVHAAVEDFMSLPITYVPAKQLRESVWAHTSRGGISTTDTWYLECARHVGGELWLSHDHADGFVDQARALYDADLVRILTESRLDE